MQILFLPFCTGKLEPIVELIEKDPMKVFVEKTPAESATNSYSMENNKFVITRESGIEKSDIIEQMKNSWEHLGNGMSCGPINNIPCSWIVCHKDADLSTPNIEKIIEFIRQQNLRNEHA